MAIVPGCYGSTVCFRIDAPECLACPQRKPCAEIVRSRESSVRDDVSRFDKVFKTDRAKTVENWFARRWKRTQDRSIASRARIDATLADWKRYHINPFMLNNGVNTCVPGSCVHAIFDFILKEGPFKPRDIVEHLSDNFQQIDRKVLDRIVKDVCDALLSLHILRKEGHVLCL